MAGKQLQAKFRNRSRKSQLSQILLRPMLIQDWKYSHKLPLYAWSYYWIHSNGIVNLGYLHIFHKRAARPRKRNYKGRRTTHSWTLLFGSLYTLMQFAGSHFAVLAG